LILGSPWCFAVIALLLGLMWLMVRRQSATVKWAALGILVATGIYCVFCNDLSGPERWLTHDSPINWPKMWHNNWRLWWIGQVGQMSAWRTGMIVAAMLIIIKLYRLSQKYIRL
jgi:hypothetical protein